MSSAAAEANKRQRAASVLKKALMSGGKISKKAIDKIYLPQHSHYWNVFPILKTKLSNPLALTSWLSNLHRPSIQLLCSLCSIIEKTMRVDICICF